MRLTGDQKKTGEKIQKKFRVFFNHFRMRVLEKEYLMSCPFIHKLYPFVMFSCLFEMNGCWRCKEALLLVA